jgi:CheY-like chemotaxis protein
VYADEGHIVQIVLNLAVNVRNAMPAQGTIEVKTEMVNLDAFFCGRHPGTTPGDYVAISVRQSTTDPVVFLNVAFNARAGTAVAFGAGTTQAIVSQYGGFMAVESRPGRGAVFSVYLPRAEASESVSAAELTNAALCRSRPETILLVDDQPITREVSRDMLEREGYQVVLAADAREAERLSEQGDRFDLLIADLEMPQTSGPDLARKLRAATPDLKVLFISGYNDPNSVGQGPTAEDAFLRKPFSVDSLGRKIRQIFDQP